ncbi:unnamed protein product, partial [Lampetra planeri]
ATPPCPGHASLPRPRLPSQATPPFAGHASLPRPRLPAQATPPCPGHASLPRPRLPSPTSGKVWVPPPRDPPRHPLGAPSPQLNIPPSWSEVGWEGGRGGLSPSYVGR